MKVLSKSDVKSFYDNWGIKQDNPGEYEDKAIDYLLENGGFESAGSVFEFGFGTGKFARELFFKNREDLRYFGQDISDTMFSITRDRLSAWSENINLVLTDGSVLLNYDDNSFDRFVSNFVFDILSEKEIKTLVSEAHRVLKSNGLLCLSSLDRGKSDWAKFKSFCWKSFYRFSPKTLGGCRPLDLRTYFDENKWNIIDEKVFDTKGVSSSILIAQPRKAIH